MILVGRFLSPFTRRVAIALQLARLGFQHQPLSTLDDRAAIAKINPLGRVPALILDDGETLIDSAAIVDCIDELAGRTRALTPYSGIDRRRVKYWEAVALGATEKAVAAFYERNRRPPEKVHQPWLDQLQGQLVAGLKALEAQLAENGGVLHGTYLTIADVTAICLVDFLRAQKSPVWSDKDFPQLAFAADRANREPAFASTKP